MTKEHAFKNLLQFKMNGFYLSEKILSDEEIDSMLLATDDFYAGKRDRALPKKIRDAIDWRPELDNKMRINDYIDYQCDFIRKIITKPAMGDIASVLMNTPDIFLFNTSLFSKPPFKDRNETGWHIDSSYLDNCASDNMISAWIPLEDIGPNNSPLLMIKHSHLWDLNEEDEHILTNQIPYSTDYQIYKNFPLSQNKCVDVEVCPVYMKRGQVSFHHLKTIHARCANYSDHDVRAISLHLQDDKNKFKPWNKNREFYLCKNENEVLCRKLQNGDPDFHDPDFCPRISIST